MVGEKDKKENGNFKKRHGKHKKAKARKSDLNVFYTWVVNVSKIFLHITIKTKTYF